MQDRFAKKIYDQPSFQKLHLKFAALLQVQLQKNITYFLKVRHLEKKKKKRLCLSNPIYLSYVQVHCLLDKAVVSAEEFATYSRFLIDLIKTSTLEIVFQLNKPFSNANHDIS